MATDQMISPLRTRGGLRRQARKQNKTFKKKKNKKTHLFNTYQLFSRFGEVCWALGRRFRENTYMCLFRTGTLCLLKFQAFSQVADFYFNLTSSQAKNPCLLVGCSTCSRAQSRVDTVLPQHSGAIPVGNIQRRVWCFPVEAVSEGWEMPLSSSGPSGCKSPSTPQDRRHITIKKPSVQTGNRFLPRDAFPNGCRLNHFIFPE